MEASDTSFDPAHSQLLETTYASVLPELNALRPDELLPVNLEIMSAMTTARGVAPRLRTMYERVRALPEFDFAKFERLEAYALAAAFAHTEHLYATRPADDLPLLQEEGLRFRNIFLMEANLLVKRGLLSADALDDLPGTNGYKNLMTDLQILVGILKASWRHLEGKSGTTKDDLVRAGLVVEQLSSLIGARELGPEAGAKTAEMRMRAFTLFTKTYDQARRAISFLRWDEDDVDSFLPSLYRGRGGRRRGSEEEAVPTGDDVSPPVTPTTPNGTTPDGAPATPGIAAAAGATGSANGKAGTNGPFVA